MEGLESENNISNNSVRFCSNCGTKLDVDAKFCKNCGKSINQDEKKKDIIKEKNEQRKVVYAGKIYKCPNCGEILNSFVTNCPSCGYEIRETKSSISISEFVAKLEEIEKLRTTNKKTGLKDIFVDSYAVNEIDKQSISLIRNFSIPNNKEDLLEFFILASSNINLKRYNDNYGTSESEDAISDAWETKFEQAYEKAKIMFGNTQEFRKIQDIYDKKHSEIRKTKKSYIYSLIGIFALLLFMLAIIYGLVFFINKNSSQKENDSNNVQSAIIENKDSVDIKNENNESSFDENTIVKDLKVTQYKYNNGDTYTIFIIDNPTEYNLSINVEVKFYNKDGKLVGSKDGTINAVEKKTKTFISFSSEDYEKLDYKLSATEEKYFECITSSLSYESVKAKNKEIVSLTNNGTHVANFVKGYALFFKDNKIVNFDYQYFSDDDGSIKPGKTITKEMNCYDEYDSVKFYFLGSADK